MRGMTIGDRMWVLNVASLFSMYSEKSLITAVLWAASFVLMIALDGAEDKLNKNKEES